MVAKNPHAVLSSGVLGTDTQIKSTPGLVYWVTLSDTQACTIQLSNDTAGTDDKWQITIPANGYIHPVFNPPLEFTVGIYLDMPTGTGDAIVGYS